MSNDNVKKFMVSSSKYIINLNHALKGIKSDIIIDFICFDHCSLIVISNKVISSSNLNMVENYIKNFNSLNLNDIQSARLLQSKMYLKILSIPYIIKSINMTIDSSVVESIITSTYIFDNIHIALKPHIIKVSPKSDMSII